MGERRRLRVGALVAVVAASALGLAPVARAAEDLTCAGMTPAQAAAAGYNVILGASDPTSGTPLPDVVLGTPGRDFISVGGGTDHVGSGLGDDIICGGPGNDGLYPDQGNDYVDAGEGDDVATTGAGNDVVILGPGADQAYSNDGDDTVDGNEGNDVIDVAIGDDVARGGPGHDVINGGSGGDRIDGGEGTDAIFAGEGVDTCVDGEQAYSCEGAPLLFSEAEPAGWFGVAPVVAGRSARSHGEFVSQDYLYEDGGAERNVASITGSHRGLSQTAGDVVYPADPACATNCADIFRVRATRGGGLVRFLVQLTTLRVADSTVAGIAIGPYGVSGGAQHRWPHDALLGTPGARHVITAWGTGGSWDGVPLSSVGGSVTVDTAANAIEVTVPESLVGTRFRASVGAGRWDTVTNTWAQPLNSFTDMPNATIARAYDLAFRPRAAAAPFPQVEETGVWFDTAQADALELHTTGGFYEDIDLAAPDTPPLATQRGHVELVYRSSITVAPHEGIVPAGVAIRGSYDHMASQAAVHYVGRFQPIAVYAPSGGWDRAFLMLHGGGGSHGFMDNTVGLKEAHGDAGRGLMVAPLGRGPSGFWTDEAHLDALEALDVATAYFGGTDPDRLTVWGYSMGAFGANRLSVTQPDRFVGSVLWEPATGGPGSTIDGATPAPGNPNDLLDNLHDVDVRLRNCIASELTPVPLQTQWLTRNELLQNRYRFRVYYGCEHLTPLWTGVPWGDDDPSPTASSRIDHTPVRVRFRTSQAWWRADLSSRLVFDRSHWVSGVRVADPTPDVTTFGTVDAITNGLGARPPMTAVATPSAGAPVFHPWHETGRDLVDGAPQGALNAFTATLTTVSAVTFTLDQMGLKRTTPLSVAITTDVPVTVTLVGGGGATTVLTVTPGTTTLTL